MDSTAEAKKLATRLNRIYQAFRDAEHIRVTDPILKRWLEELEEIAYEIEDALDEWDWKNTKLQMDQLEYDSISHWEKVIYICLCFRRDVVGRNVNLKIKQLIHRLDLIGEKYGEYRYKFIPNPRTRDHDFRRSMTASVVNVSEVYGRDGDKESLVSKLLFDQEEKSAIPVISIVGAGGMGKTKLAQIVFNDERVANYFYRRLWVSVSHPYDEIMIATAILEELNLKTPDFSEFEELLRGIERAISGKNFLLVLDDMWTEDYNLWEQLRNRLNRGGPRSKILVTTRNARVARMMGSTQTQIHPLQPLSDSHCWTLFKELAFRYRTEQDFKILEETGLEIVKKCKGLPLAVEVIGSHLRFKKSLGYWQKFLDSQVWEWETARKEIFPVLLFSYEDLHLVARRCFLYCAIFPKDEWINVDMLIRIWSAQGFLSSFGSSDDREFKGREIFDNLAMRCFFQEVKKDIQNRVAYCKMHGIIHDFAKFLAKKEGLIVENVDAGAKSAYQQTARHLNLYMDKGQTSPNPIPHEILHEKCRSLFAASGDDYCTIPADFLRRLKRLKVLSLPYCELETSEIRNLIHLRYLDLTGSLIKELPETICDLYNLETLVLEQCDYLSGLPQRIHKLRKLRHLLNNGTSLELPERFKQLRNLWTLSKINGKNLEMLGNFNQLRGCLSIHILENANDQVEAAKKADLKNKQLIRELYLFFGGKVQYEVMEALQPHSNLPLLTFSGPRLPKWVSNLTNLRELTISMTKDELAGDGGTFSSFPPLGKLLPFLEVFWLCRMVGMECLSHKILGIDAPQQTGSTSYAFWRLKRLTFTDCKDWEEWEDISEEEEISTNISILPSLTCLELYNCRKLQSLPRRLLHKASSLEHLIMDGCENLAMSIRDWGQSLTNERICKPPKGWNYRNIVIAETDEQGASKYLTPGVIQRGKLREQL